MLRFTREEKIALIFLLVTLFAGTGILYYKKLNPAAGRFIEFSEKEIRASEKININTATEEELVKLKNVGPVLARRIISYRAEHGPFKDTEDIKNVKGIGDKTYEKLKEQLGDVSQTEDAAKNPHKK